MASPDANGGTRRRPSQYGDPYPLTRALIEEGRSHLIGGGMDAGCPVRVLQGMRDPDVPWEVSMRLAAVLRSADVQVTLIKNGDHRLSRDEDIALLLRTAAAMVGEAG